LVLAWESVSLDAVTGADQNSSTYWKRIGERFSSQFWTYASFKFDILNYGLKMLDTSVVE
jgi:hypothetical protein